MNLPIVAISARVPYYDSDKDPEFARRNLEYALDTVLREGPCLIMIPYGPDVFNYLAYGFDEEDAKEKATNKGIELKNCMREICQRRGYSYAETIQSAAQVRVIDWEEDIEKNPRYVQILKNINELYETDKKFRRNVREATGRTLMNRIRHNSATKRRMLRKGLVHYRPDGELDIEKAIDIAAHYPLAELAAHELLGGKYIYHEHTLLHEEWIAGHYKCGRPEGLSYGIINRNLAA